MQTYFYPLSLPEYGFEEQERYFFEKYGQTFNKFTVTNVLHGLEYMIKKQFIQSFESSILELEMERSDSVLTIVECRVRPLVTETNLFFIHLMLTFKRLGFKKVEFHQCDYHLLRYACEINYYTKQFVVLFHENAAEVNMISVPELTPSQKSTKFTLHKPKENARLIQSFMSLQKKDELMLDFTDKTDQEKRQILLQLSSLPFYVNKEKINIKKLIEDSKFYYSVCSEEYKDFFPASLLFQKRLESHFIKASRNTNCFYLDNNKGISLINNLDQFRNVKLSLKQTTELDKVIVTNSQSKTVDTHNIDDNLFPKLFTQMIPFFRDPQDYKITQYVLRFFDDGIKQNNGSLTKANLTLSLNTNNEIMLGTLKIQQDTDINKLKKVIPESIFWYI